MTTPLVIISPWKVVESAEMNKRWPLLKFKEILGCLMSFECLIEKVSKLQECNPKEEFMNLAIFVEFEEKVGSQVGI